MRRWKKFLLVILACNFLFVSVERERAHAAEVGAAMTIAQAVGAGITGAALTPILLGVAGLAAVGAVIYKWDTVVEFGHNVYSGLTDKGIDPNSVVNTDTYEVEMNADTISTFANAVDEMPEKINKYLGDEYQIESMKIRSYKEGGVHYLPAYTQEVNLEWTSGEMYIVGNLLNAFEIRNLTVHFVTPTGDSRQTSVSAFSKDGLGYLKTDNNIPAGSIITLLTQPRRYVGNDSVLVGITNARIVDRNRFNEMATVTVNDGFAAVPTTVADREAGAFSALNGASSLKIPANLDLTNANLATIMAAAPVVNPDTPEGSYGNILQSLWQAVVSLPARIAAAFVALFQNMQDFLAGLWADAGLVWSGITDAVNNANTVLGNLIAAGAASLGAGIDSINDNLAGWFDNIRSGIDNINTYLGGLLQDLRAGIEGGLSAIGTTLTNIWQNILDLPQTLARDLTEAAELVTAAIIPTDLDMTNYTSKMDELRGNLKDKFEFITIPIASIKNLFSSPKSLYDVSFEIMGQRVFVLPLMFKSVVDVVRPVLTGVAVISTFISIYRKITPDEVIA